MTASAFDPAAPAVLAYYPALLRGENLVALGNHGGFSGAQLWRIEGAAQPLCLRAWPAPGPPAERLRLLHPLMRTARDAGLLFVPAVFATSAGATWVEHGGRFWELTTWQPGEADFRAHPYPTRLAAACVALGRLHAVWNGVLAAVGPCPAVQRRLAAAREWQEMVRAGWRPAFASTGHPALRPCAERAWQLVQRHLDRVPQVLGPWVERPLPLQPCLCDVWHDHVLFVEDAVSGLVDYGSVKVDHVAVDLARLLGSLVGDQAGRRDAGLEAYRSVRELSEEEKGLVAVLDETGTLVAAANWLKWVYREQRTFADVAAVARRLAGLVERVEGWAR